jgi:transcriptional regulator with GAF, ATPase, and Fis domain
MVRSEWLDNVSLKKRRLNYYLYLIFGLLFFLPTSGLLLFGYRHGIFSDHFLALLLLGVLILSWAGVYLLRTIFEPIRYLSNEVRANPDLPQAPGDLNRKNELSYLVDSFGIIERHFSQALGRIEKKSADITTLRELAEICTVTFNPDEILQDTLKRCLRLTDADMGSILMLDFSKKKKFIIKATMGIGDHVKVGDAIDFDTSLAKYAVINKVTLVVEDIEKDPRFGRKNRIQYGSKGFICVPLRSMNTIIGVLTLSSKESKKSFNNENTEILTPLLSTAILTYENLRLIETNREKAQAMGTIAKIFNLVNSSLPEQDLIQAVLEELKSLVNYHSAMLLLQENMQPPGMKIVEMMGYPHRRALQGRTVPLVQGSLLKHAIGLGRSLIVPDSKDLKHEVDLKYVAVEGCQG